jgi:hypothetical protein
LLACNKLDHYGNISLEREVAMKITKTKPGVFALWLHEHEVLESTFVTEAYVLFGLKPEQAEEFSKVFFYAVGGLLDKKWKIHQAKSEGGRRAGLARAAQLRQQKTAKED